MAAIEPWQPAWFGDSGGGYTWDYTTSVKYIESGTSDEWVTLTVPNYDGVTLLPSRQPGPESALEWLDRRVDEIRVAL